LLLFVAAYALQLKRLLTAYAADQAPRVVPMLVVLLAMQLVYFLTYSGDYVAAMLLGVSISLSSQLRVGDRGWSVRLPATEVR
jgi:hypothetical protein